MPNDCCDDDATKFDYHYTDCWAAYCAQLVLTRVAIIQIESLQLCCFWLLACSSLILLTFEMDLKILFVVDRDTYLG